MLITPPPLISVNDIFLKFLLGFLLCGFPPGDLSKISPRIDEGFIYEISFFFGSPTVSQTVFHEFPGWGVSPGISSEVSSIIPSRRFLPGFSLFLSENSFCCWSQDISEFFCVYPRLSSMIVFRSGFWDFCRNYCEYISWSSSPVFFQRFFRLFLVVV